MHSKRLFLAGIFLFNMAASAVATDIRHTVTPHGGFCVPLGAYAQKSEAANSGFAKFGFGGGIDYDLLVGQSGFSWSNNFSYLSSDFEANYFSRGLNVVLQESGAYSNYAFLTGIKYEKNLSDNFRLFAIAQGGGSFTKGPFINGFLDTDKEQVPFLEFQMGNDTSAGFAFGLGMVTNETTTIQIRYYSLGTHDYTASVNYADNGADKSANVGWSQPVSMIFISVGYAIDLGF